MTCSSFYRSVSGRAYSWRCIVFWTELTATLNILQCFHCCLLDPLWKFWLDTADTFLSITLNLLNVYLSIVIPKPFKEYVGELPLFVIRVLLQLVSFSRILRCYTFAPSRHRVLWCVCWVLSKFFSACRHNKVLTAWQIHHRLMVSSIVSELLIAIAVIVKHDERWASVGD